MDMSELKSSFELTYEKEYERRNYPRVRQSLDPAKLADFEAIVSHMCVSLYKLGHDAIHRWDDKQLTVANVLWNANKNLSTDWTIPLGDFVREVWHSDVKKTSTIRSAVCKFAKFMNERGVELKIKVHDREGVHRIDCKLS